jgi:hypothetical protein
MSVCLDQELITKGMDGCMFDKKKADDQLWRSRWNVFLKSCNLSEFNLRKTAKAFTFDQFCAKSENFLSHFFIEWCVNGNASSDEIRAIVEKVDAVYITEPCPIDTLPRNKVMKIPVKTNI